MLKNLVKLVNLPRNGPKLFLSAPAYSFATQVAPPSLTGYAELQQIAKLLGTVVSNHAIFSILHRP